MSKEHINHIGDREAKIFVTKEEHDRFATDSTSQRQEEYDDYQKGYQNEMVEVQRQLGLRKREVPITNPAKKSITQHAVNNSDKATTEKDNADKDHLESQKGKKPMAKVVNKVPEVRKEITILKENLTSFNLENEISKIKISLPFNEILRNYEYTAQLIRMLKMDELSVSTNIQSMSKSDIVNL